MPCFCCVGGKFVIFLLCCKPEYINHSFHPSESVFFFTSVTQKHSLIFSPSPNPFSVTPLDSPSAPPSQLAIQFREASGSITCIALLQDYSHPTHPHPCFLWNKHAFYLFLFFALHLKPSVEYIALYI